MAFEAITIETQEQYDKLVKDRLDRHETEIRGKVSAEYADYEDLKSGAAKHETDRTAWETEKAEYEKKLTAANTSLAEANTRLTVFQTESMKSKAIKEAGIPVDVWDDAGKLIKGDTEDEIKASAAAIKKLLGGKQQAPPPKKAPELGGGEDKSALKAYKDALLKGES
jgi:hypothetical protein